ncbi:MAG: hypothetical protein C4306_05650 [Thermoleophilia bacterium]
MTYRKVTIRPYRPQDESRLFALARDSFGERPAWSAEGTLATLETDTVFVAELEDEPAGYVAVEQEGDVVRIEQLLVSPLHEHQGVGHQLLDYAEGYAIAAGARRLQVVVEEDNVKARDFYRRRGFVAAARGLLELTLPQR